MNTRSLVLRFVPLVIVILFLAVSAAASVARDAHVADPHLRLIGLATQRNPEDLQLLEAQPMVLADGRRLTRYKALDTVTADVVSVALDGESAIDSDQARATAAVYWRTQHGALTPTLLQRLTTLQPDDRLEVIVWLKADVRATTWPNYIPLAHTGQSGLDRRSSAIQYLADVSRSRNTASLQAQIEPIQTRFEARLRQFAIDIGYHSPLAPLIYLPNVTRHTVEVLARLPEVDAVYAVPANAGPALNVARPAQNADLINLADYNGAGVKVAVTEGQRVYELNPYLNIAGFFDAAQPAEAHPTAVAGILGSTHPIYTGLANGALLYSGNGSITDTAIMAAAIDWSAITATVVNNSWYWDAGDATFTAFDRHMDYLVRYNANFIAGAAGNFGSGCTNPIGFTTPYVTSPAKAYNVLTVGNYDAHGTLGWADDTLYPCSGYGDPGTDITDTFHAKPEVVAIGTGIVSTLVSSQTNTALGSVGTGTSYATPMVSALAADLIQADPNLAVRPEALRSIIMATALHNIEGESSFSDRDGAGGLDATAAIATVERGDWSSQEISDTTTFPITYTLLVYQGERARFVINWLADATSDYLSTTLPADLDLVALRADGETVITASASVDNNFEVVDFIAPATEVYQFRVTRAGAWTGPNTRLGAAGWRGIDRLPPDTGYLYPAAPPSTQPFAVRPADWPLTNHWRAVGVRSIDSNHDLELDSRSRFDDPGLRIKLTESHAISGSVDIIVVDGHHWPATEQEQYVVQRMTGQGGYFFNWSNPGINLAGLGRTGPYTLTGQEVVKIFDADFDAEQLRQFELQPGPNNQSDLGLMLFKSDGTVPASWVGARGGQVAKADASDQPGETEVLRYLHSDPAPDVLGLVVYSKLNAPAEFYLRISLDQIISFDPITDTVFGAPPIVVTATASSGLPVMFVSLASACEVSPDGTITIISAGNCTIAAIQAGDGAYNPAVNTRTFFIAKADQSIDFEPLPDRVFGDPPVVLTATASSSLPVTFTAQSPACSIEGGSTARLVGAGLCSIEAKQAGDINFQPAPPISHTFLIERAPQAIAFEPAITQSYSLQPLPITATASSALTVTLSTTSTACLIDPPSKVRPLELGDCTLIAQQSGDANYLPAADVTRTVTIVRAEQTIDFAPITDKALGELPFLVTAEASSALPVTFTTDTPVCAVTRYGLVSLIDLGYCSIVAHQSGNDFFYPAPAAGQLFLIGHLAYLPVVFK